MRQKTQRELSAEVLQKLCSLGLRLIELHNPTKIGCSCGQKICGSPGKHPLKKDWQKRGWITDATTAVNLLATSRNTGILTGTGLLVIDVDDKHNGGISLGELEKKNQALPDTLTVKTGGGWHYYFKYASSIAVPNSVGKLGDGIDVRADGGYVVAPPSLHANGNRYEFSGKVDYIVEAPDWLLDLCIKKKEKVHVEGGKVAEGQRNKHLASIAGSLRKNGLGEKAIRESLMIANNDQCDPPLEESEVREISRSIASYPVEGEHAWKELLNYDSRGSVIRSEGNCSIILAKSDEFKDCLEYDNFTGRGGWIKQPNSGHLQNKLGPEYDPDSDFTEVQNILAKEFKVTFSRACIQDAMLATLKRSKKDSLKDYIEGLSWDGKPRLNRWLTTYAHADDNEYSQVIGRKFLIAAVARALKPGAKVDYMLILESEKQGMGKSTLVSILGGPFYDDGSIDPKSKDFMLKLRGCWFYEVSELSGLRRGQVELLKAFISDTADSYREPYGRYSALFPRRCVFVGTTNEKHYLQDVENRRFWPVEIGWVKFDELKRDRDQLFAEAREAFRSGEEWWPAIKQRTMFEAEQSKRRDVHDDPWLDELRLYHNECMKRNIKKLPQAAIWARLGIPVERRIGFIGVRIGRCMDVLGWDRYRNQYERGYLYKKEVCFRDEFLQEVSEEPPPKVRGKPYSSQETMGSWSGADMARPDGEDTQGEGHNRAGEEFNL